MVVNPFLPTLIPVLKLPEAQANRSTRPPGEEPAEAYRGGWEQGRCLLGSSCDVPLCTGSQWPTNVHPGI